MDNRVTLILTPLIFYSAYDEDAMFEWLNKIKSVISYRGIGRELHVYVVSKNIPKLDLIELMGLFDRYGYSIEPLKVFMNEENKRLFKESAKTFTLPGIGTKV